MKETFVCDICGHTYPVEEMELFDESTLCPHCLDRRTVVCDYCGERVWQEDSQSDTDTVICQDCYDTHYTRCIECDDLVRLSDACYPDEHNPDDPYCAHCAEQFENSNGGDGIQSYYYKPTPIFYGEGSRYFGVELEIDGGGEYDDRAYRVMRIANCVNELIYCKHDGSLEEGFEIVTHPMTLEYHLKQMPWDDVMQEAICMGYRSHQTGTCGLHVHVNRDSLGSTMDEQEDCIARVLFFIENHWNELLKFSRRTEAQMQQWAARYGRKDTPKEVMDHVKSKAKDRYSCINLLNQATIEFRMFRGTLRCSTLTATLQLVNEICNVAVFMSDEEVAKLTWTEFVSCLDKETCAELIAYLKERQLYVNEPVYAEEEF